MGKDRTEYFKTYRKENRDKAAVYRLANKDRIVTAHRDWVKKNPKRNAATKERWRDKNPEYNSIYHKVDYMENRPARAESRRIYSHNLRITVLTHYGNGVMACVMCGINDPDVLQLDHINNDGHKHRRKSVKGTNLTAPSETFRNLIKAGLPTGYQTLCANHNMKKEVIRRRAAYEYRLNGGTASKPTTI